MGQACLRMCVVHHFGKSVCNKTIDFALHRSCDDIRSGREDPDPLRETSIWR